MLVSATNIYSILCVGVMYEAEGSHIRKLLEEVLDEESNVEFGYESESLAMDLTKEHRGECAACSHLSRELGTKLKRRITSPAREPEEKRPKFQGRCAICPRSKDRKTKYICQKCEKFLCLQHVIPLCEECVCA